MKNILITIPYPPSVNKIYHNRVIVKDPGSKNHLRGRGLTKEARDYKNYVATLLNYKFKHMKFGDKLVKITILDNPRNLRGDSHNGLKIVFDAIELSGLIDNDKQIVSYEVIPGKIKKTDPTWTIRLEQFDGQRQDIKL